MNKNNLNHYAKRYAEGCDIFSLAKVAGESAFSLKNQIDSYIAARIHRVPIKLSRIGKIAPKILQKNVQKKGKKA